MADTPRTWAILQALQVRLQEISIVAGYRTDAGEDVRLEPSESEIAAPRVTIYSGGTALIDPNNPSEREFTLIIEPAVPVALETAHELIVAMAEDIEQALDTRLPLPQALPLRFVESLFLDRPEGMPAMVAQLMFTTRFRR